MKDAKKYLSRIRLLDVKIAQKEKELEMLRAETENISPKSDGDRIQTSVNDRMSANIAKIIDIEKEIAQKQVELIIVRHTIIDKIHELSNPILVDILYKRYVEYKSYNLISYELGYNIVYIRQLHSKALELL